jgi:prepilin-type N-terminal cleavage/methylation domain-containing protein
MKNPTLSIRRPGFTLLETVIAIGVLAVLLTGFMVVFAPAAAGIKRSISVQEADRLASTIEQELVTLRGQQELTNYKTGFGKSFKFIEESHKAGEALLVYQYRGSLSSSRSDETPEPVTNIQSKLPGKDYVVQTMVRRRSDPEFKKDLAALEGGIYLVKCTQLIFNSGELKPGTAGKIVDPKGSNAAAADADAYPEAVIAFSADFYTLPARSASFFDSSTGFAKSFTNAKNPVFTRNLAVRR